jgi:hypothetical protein
MLSCHRPQGSPNVHFRLRSTACFYRLQKVPARCHSHNEFFRTRPPSGDDFKGFREGYIQRVHPFEFEDIDRPGQRGRIRWDKNGVPSVLEFLYDESQDEGFIELDECRLPYFLPVVPRHLLGKASEQSVTGDSFEKSLLYLLPGSSPCGSADGNTDQKSNHQRHLERQGFSAGIQSGSSMAKGRTNPTADFIPLSSTKMAR